MIRLADNIHISENDIIYKFSRSAGPGGQNVNKLNTRVTLLFNITGCKTLADEQKRLLLSRYQSKIFDGFLKVVSQKHRTQQANRKAAINYLVKLLIAGLKKRPVRKKTTIPRSAHLKRLNRKRRRSEIKQSRKIVSYD